MPAPDKRKNRRVKKPCYAQINIYSDGGPTNWEIVTLQDLSSGGMSFSYHKPLAAGTPIRARIYFPPADKPVEAAGTVVRSDTGGTLRSTGVKFSEIDPEQQDLIDRFAAKWFPSG